MFLPYTYNNIYKAFEIKICYIFSDWQRFIANVSVISCVRINALSSMAPSYVFYNLSRVPKLNPFPWSEKENSKVDHKKGEKNKDNSGVFFTHFREKQAKKEDWSKAHCDTRLKGLPDLCDRVFWGSIFRRPKGMQKRG